MRDMRRIREKGGFNLEAPGAVGWALTGVLLLGAMFGGGYVVGARHQRLENELKADRPSLAKLSQESQRHRELTFYSNLSQNKVKE